MPCPDKEDLVLSHGDHDLFFSARRPEVIEVGRAFSDESPEARHRMRVTVRCRECGAESSGTCQYTPRSVEGEEASTSTAEHKALAAFRGSWSSSCEYVTVLRVMTE